MTQTEDSLEPYGFSRAAWATFGVPAWEAVHFAVTDAGATETVTVRLNPIAGVVIAVRAGWPAFVLIGGGLLLLAARRRRKSRPSANCSARS